MFAKSGIIGNGRTFEGIANLASFLDSLTEQLSSGIINWHTNSNLGGMVSNSAFWNRLAESIFRSLRHTK